MPLRRDLCKLLLAGGIASILPPAFAAPAPSELAG
jgi:hypothetical protein